MTAAVPLRFCATIIVWLTAVAAPSMVLSRPLHSSAGVDSHQQAIFVSPLGADDSNGMSIGTPLRTLARARDVARETNIRSIYLLPGRFNISTAVLLDERDRGERWASLRPQATTIDGAGTAEGAFRLSSTSNITIVGLVLSNFLRWGISMHETDGISILDNKITNIICDDGNQGGIVSVNTFTNGEIRGNVVSFSGYAGILVAASPGDRIDNLRIASNEISDTCRSVNDCGAIYADDRGHQSAGIYITDNVITRFGPATLLTNAVYLDDLLSGAVVSGNIISGPGANAIEIHGGDHNDVVLNAFDLTAITNLLLYVSKDDRFHMADNRIACNHIRLPPSEAAQLPIIINGYAPPIIEKNTVDRQAISPAPPVAVAACR